MTRILILILMSASNLFAQQLERFSFSDCLVECKNDSSVVEEIRPIGQLTLIRVKTYAPCNGNFAGGVKVSPSFVNLKFSTRPTVVHDKEAKVAELIEVADCNCVFRFVYEIRGLRKIDSRSIRINGEALKDIDAKNIMTEILINMDSIK
jgi:hypothetical protein